MNKKETIEAIKVMQAFVDGDDIKVDEQTNKYNVNNSELGWNWSGFKYRVKPKPIERWIGVWEQETITPQWCYASEEQCVSTCKGHGFIKAVKLVEVSDD